ncbi:MAG: hypothetical protein KGI28_05645 [Thaumarchaeota archaeon]|nr:hypothetical protein [Nitrososphaerota archaeon]
MRLLVVIPIFVALVVLGIVSSNTASANVWIPDNEYLGYYDSNGIYTVVGAVKNTEDKPIIPSVTINVKDDDNAISDNFTLSTVNSGKDIPFKIKIPQVEGKNAILEKPQVSFVTSNHDAVNIDVIYDRTLIKHPDGHSSGFILNNDTSPAYGVIVYAAIYGKDGKFLDTGKSIETIEKMEPGQKIAFSMYPDPNRASKLSYYSCFALGEDPTQTIKLQRTGQPFYITYVSSGYVNDAKFDDFAQSVSLTIRYPFPDKGFVNFMIPEESNDQKYTVTLDGKQIEFLQSKDPDGYWHVAFDLAPQSTSYVTISGFSPIGAIPEFSLKDSRSFLLIIIPIAAAIISIIIWKKRTD